MLAAAVAMHFRTPARAESSKRLSLGFGNDSILVTCMTLIVRALFHSRTRERGGGVIQSVDWISASLEAHDLNSHLQWRFLVANRRALAPRGTERIKDALGLMKMLV